MRAGEKQKGKEKEGGKDRERWTECSVTLAEES